MSRTKRRKTSSDWKNWVTDYKYVNGVMTKVKLEGKEYIKKKARFFSDYDMGWNAPAKFRRLISREQKSKNKAELDRVNKNIELDEDRFVPQKRTAGYEYF